MLQTEQPLEQGLQFALLHSHYYPELDLHTKLNALSSQHCQLVLMQCMAEPQVSRIDRISYLWTSTFCQDQS